MKMPEFCGISGIFYYNTLDEMRQKCYNIYKIMRKQLRRVYYEKNISCTWCVLSFNSVLFL